LGKVAFVPPLSSPSPPVFGVRYPNVVRRLFDSLRENSVTVRHPNMLLKKPLSRLTMFNSFTMLVPPAQDDQVFRRHAMVF
jgi:hypothetical protein